MKNYIILIIIHFCFAQDLSPELTDISPDLENFDAEIDISRMQVLKKGYPGAMEASAGFANYTWYKTTDCRECMSAGGRMCSY